MSGEGYIHHARQAPEINHHRFFGNPAAARTPADSSTADTSTMATSSPAVAATDALPPVFLYPTGVLTVNNIDVVQVSYESGWNSVNLTLFCQMGLNPNAFALAKINQIEQNGTYAFAPIQAGMEIPLFPTNCNFMLCDANNSTDYTTGVGFTMISTKGAAATYAMAVIQTSVPSTTPAEGLPSATHTAAESVKPTTTPGAADVSSSNISAAGATPFSSASASGGLSDGVKAGVSISVILGVFALVAVVVFFMRRRRRTDKLETMQTLRSTATSVDTAHSEKTVVEEDPAAAPLPPKDKDNVLLKVVENHRNSEDWRRFFGNAKARKPGVPS